MVRVGHVRAPQTALTKGNRERKKREKEKQWKDEQEKRSERNKLSETFYIEHTTSHHAAAPATGREREKTKTKRKQKQTNQGEAHIHRRCRGGGLTSRRSKEKAERREKKRTPSRLQRRRLLTLNPQNLVRGEETQREKKRALSRRKTRGDKKHIAHKKSPPPKTIGADLLALVLLLFIFTCCPTQPVAPSAPRCG